MVAVRHRKMDTAVIEKPNRQIVVALAMKSRSRGCQIQYWRYLGDEHAHAGSFAKLDAQTKYPSAACAAQQRERMLAEAQSESDACRISRLACALKTDLW